MTPALQRPNLNRARSIREACVECMGYALHEVNRCPDNACPLWEWRRGPGGPERTDTPLRRQHGTRTPLAPTKALPESKSPNAQVFSDEGGE